MEVFSKSDIGLVRNQNQDDCRFGVISPSCVWAVVCDGMGGANGGNIAAQRQLIISAPKLPICTKMI